MFNNQVEPQTYFNEFIDCSKRWALPDALYCLFGVYTITMIVSDFVILR